MPNFLYKKLYPFAVSLGLAATPFAALAQLENVETLAERSLDIINIVVVIVFVLALLVFAWGIVKYITAASDPTKVKEARGFLWWGIIGIFVLAAVFGLVQFIGRALGVSTTGGGSFNPPGVVRPPAP